jgi:xanthine dehydrogenase accessory factor
LSTKTVTEPWHSDEAVIETALAWKAEGKGVAIATVVSTWGSAPRPTGSQIAINEDAGFIGSVSGGCIEGAVIHAGLDVLGGASPQVLEFGVSNAEAWEVGLACGGTIRIHVCALDEKRTRLYQKLQTARDSNQSAVWISSLTQHTDQLVLDGDPNLTSDLEKAVKSATLSDKAGPFTSEDDELFINPFNPPLRMFIIGAVHIAQPLAHMASEAGYDITVIDPREAFASVERFPGFVLSHEWPDEALEKLAPDLRSAIVTLSHDPKIDDPALTAALKTSCFYIGSLGSKKTHAARLERLEADGFTPSDLSRIHGPVGLSIGAKSPAEIAISILAEITDILRGPST